MKLTTPDAQQQLAELDKQISVKQQQIEAEAAAVSYVDPADKPESEQVMTVTENVWMEDDFPAGGKLHAAPVANSWILPCRSSSLLPAMVSVNSG
jgi:hypothetical protein